MIKEKKTVSTAQRDSTETGVEATQEGIRYLLKGPYPDVKKMKLETLRSEVEMWRNVWSWVPSEVKYYVSRTGSLCGITQRNYVRHMGMLLDTHWIIDEIELGVFEKVYDTGTGEYYWERKIIKVKPSGLMDIQWIAERTKETEILAQAEHEIGTEPPKPSDEEQ
jgi:hypothetical protein